jgi:hypothetical protein
MKFNFNRWDHRYEHLAKAKNAATTTSDLDPNLPGAHEAWRWYYNYG